MNHPKKIKCEICSQLGTIKCTHCKHAFYCSENHRITDWKNIHQIICDYLKELKSPDPVLLTAVERDLQKHKQHEIKIHVQNICRQQAQEMIWLKKYAEAVPALMQELRWIINMHGAVSIEAISSYCTLCEACLNLGSLDKAEEYIAQALWCFQKGHVSNLVKFCVYQALGKIYEAHGMITELRDALAEHVYYGAEKWNPGSLHLTWGYLHLGLSFDQNPMVAHSFFSKVIAIIKSHVVPFNEKYFSNTHHEVEIPKWEVEHIYHNEDLLEILTQTKEQLEGPCALHTSPEELANLLFLLGVFHHLAATNKAKNYLEEARELGEKTEGCEDIVTAAKSMIQKEEQRLSKWFQTKMVDAMIWEGRPGTWHDIDVASDSSTHSSLIRYYEMNDD